MANFEWVNQLFLWPFSIAMLVITGGCCCLNLLWFPWPQQCLTRQVSFRQSRVEYRRDSHYLSYPSETLYGLLGTCIGSLMLLTMSQWPVDDHDMIVIYRNILCYAVGRCEWLFLCCINMLKSSEIHNVVLEMPKVMPIPRWSMYGIFTYIWVIYGVNVGRYTIHGSSGIRCWALLRFKFHISAGETQLQESCSREDFWRCWGEKSHSFR